MRRAVVKAITCSMQGRKAQMWTGRRGSRGDGGCDDDEFNEGDDGSRRERCGRARAGSGRSRKTAVACGDSGCEGLSAG